MANCGQKCVYGDRNLSCLETDTCDGPVVTEARETIKIPIEDKEPAKKDETDFSRFMSEHPDKQIRNFRKLLSSPKKPIYIEWPPNDSGQDGKAATKQIQLPKQVTSAGQLKRQLADECQSFQKKIEPQTDGRAEPSKTSDLQAGGENVPLVQICDEIPERIFQQNMTLLKLDRDNSFTREVHVKPFKVATGDEDIDIDDMIKKGEWSDRQTFDEVQSNISMKDRRYIPFGSEEDTPKSKKIDEAKLKDAMKCEDKKGVIILGNNQSRRWEPNRSWDQCVECECINDRVRRPMARLCHKRPMPPIVIPYHEIERIKLKIGEKERLEKECEERKRIYEARKAGSRCRQNQMGLTVEAILERVKQEKEDKDEKEKAEIRELLKEAQERKDKDSAENLAKAKKLMLYRKGLVRDFHGAMALSKMMQEMDEIRKSDGKISKGRKPAVCWQECMRKLFRSCPDYYELDFSLYPDTGRPGPPVAKEVEEKPYCADYPRGRKQDDDEAQRETFDIEKIRAERERIPYWPPEPVKEEETHKNIKALEIERERLQEVRNYDDNYQKALKELESLRMENLELNRMINMQDPPLSKEEMEKAVTLDDWKDLCKMRKKRLLQRSQFEAELMESCEQEAVLSKQQKVKDEYCQHLHDADMIHTFIQCSDRELDRQCEEFIAFKDKCDGIRLDKEKQERLRGREERQRKAAEKLVSMRKKDNSSIGGDYPKLKEKWEAEWEKKMAIKSQAKKAKFDHVINDFKNRTNLLQKKKDERDYVKGWTKEAIFLYENTDRDCDKVNVRRKEAMQIAEFNKEMVTKRDLEEYKERERSAALEYQRRCLIENEMTEMKKYAEDCIQDWASKGRDVRPMLQAMKKWNYEGGSFPHKPLNIKKAANSPSKDACTTAARLGFCTEI